MALQIQANTPNQPVTLVDIIPTVRLLPALDKLRLIRILAEELESVRGIFPFEYGKTYSLPTPYDTFGAADILAEAMTAYQAHNS